MKNNMYNNTISSFRRWCRENLFNTKYDTEREFHKLAPSIYMEVSLSDFSDGSLTTFWSIREYNPETQTFERLSHDYSDKNIDNNKILEIIDKYSEMHDSVII